MEQEPTGLFAVRQRLNAGESIAALPSPEELLVGVLVSSARPVVVGDDHDELVSQ